MVILVDDEHREQEGDLVIAAEKITPEAEKALLDKITDRYNTQMSPYYAASRLWVDGVIDPLETRTVISEGITMANHAPVKQFNVGVLQT